MHYTICDVVLDLVQNSIEADACVVELSLIETQDTWTVIIADNGRGMDTKTMKRVTDPFFTNGEKHKARKVGLGIPFLLQMAGQVQGSWNIESTPGTGTTVSFSLPKHHIDLPPVGDIPLCLLSAFCFSDHADIAVHRFRDGIPIYSVKRSELLDAVGTLTDVQALVLAKQYLESLET